MTQIVGEVKQNVLGKCPKYKVKLPRGDDGGDDDGGGGDDYDGNGEKDEMPRLL